MARVKSGTTTHRRHRKILRLARGYRGGNSKLFRPANEAVMKALRHAYVDRRRRKRDFRALWIQRINAAARQEGMSYSRLISGLHRAGVGVNRKMLAELAIRDRKAFVAIVARAREALARP
ncbi:MAG: 50S ribosomal protein L20 [Firmicutes bacterium]|nr:50S ribosomal protein L20 [Bacillota bacterium]